MQVQRRNKGAYDVVGRIKGRMEERLAVRSGSLFNITPHTHPSRGAFGERRRVAVSVPTAFQLSFAEAAPHRGPFRDCDWQLNVHPASLFGAGRCGGRRRLV